MPKPKKIINDPAKSVDEFIEGLLFQYPNKLAKLQNHHVVLKQKFENQVHLLSGGGSGHEPSHAGWIGSGMLSGAICGGIFASPSVASILAAIRAAKNDKGVLLVVKSVSSKSTRNPRWHFATRTRLSVKHFYLLSTTKNLVHGRSP